MRGREHLLDAISRELTLVSRHGQLVTKDELMAEVWPGVVVEENNIQVHISAVRKVLAAAGDGALDRLGAFVV